MNAIVCLLIFASLIPFINCKVFLINHKRMCNVFENEYRIEHGLKDGNDWRIYMQYVDDSEADSSEKNTAEIFKKFCPGTLGNDEHRRRIKKLIVQARIKYLMGEAFQNCTELISINLSYNLIETIYSGTFSNLPKLEDVFLEYNRITTLEQNIFVNSPNLYILNLNGNLMQVWNEEILTNTTFNRVTIRNNTLIDIDENAFRHLPTLKSLDLSFGGLTYINPLWLKDTEVNFFYAANNHLYAIPKYAFANRKMDYVEIENCKCNFVDEFAMANASIGTISFSHNKVKDYSFVKHLKSVENLCLDNNTINQLIPGAFGNAYVYHLRLSYNQIQTVPNNAFPKNVSTLNLAYNKIIFIEAYAFAKLSSLSILDLSYNMITRINRLWFVDAPIVNLFFLGNQIRSLLPKQFMDMNKKKVHTIDLSTNLIANIQEEALYDGPEFIRQMVINDNRLTELDPEMFKHVNITYFYMIKSPKIKYARKIESLVKVTEQFLKVYVPLKDVRKDFDVIWGNNLFKAHVIFENSEMYNMEQFRRYDRM